MRRTIALILLLTWQAIAAPWVVAHRGGTELGPENTLVTFQRAVELGVDAIELDIHQSADGELFVIHDGTLDRTFGQSGKVAEMSAARLREIGVPTLRSVFDLVGRRVHLVVEIKEPHAGIEDHLLEALRGAGLEDHAIVISFHQSSLKKLRELSPGLATGYLFGKETRSPVQLKQEIGVTYLGPHYSLVTQEWLTQAHQAGLKVSPWTVDDEARMRSLADWGIDAVTTNKPTLLKQVLSSGKLEPATRSN